MFTSNVDGQFQAHNPNPNPNTPNGPFLYIRFHRHASGSVVCSIRFCRLKHPVLSLGWEGSGPVGTTEPEPSRQNRMLDNDETGCFRRQNLMVQDRMLQPGRRWLEHPVLSVYIRFCRDDRTGCLAVCWNIRFRRDTSGSVVPIEPDVLQYAGTSGSNRIHPVTTDCHNRMFLDAETGCF